MRETTSTAGVDGVGGRGRQNAAAARPSLAVILREYGIYVVLAVIAIGFALTTGEGFASINNCS